MNKNSVLSIRLPVVTLCLALLGAACGSGASTDNTAEPGDVEETLPGTEDQSSPATEVGGAAQTDDPVRDQLADARQLWAQAAIDTYTISYAYSCFCEYEISFEVEVADGQLASSEKVTDDPNPTPGEALTIEQMFDVIERALDENAHFVDVRYDSETGRPLSYLIDADRDTSDGEFGLTVSEFLPDGATEAVPGTPMPVAAPAGSEFSADFCETFTFLGELDDQPETSEEAEAVMVAFVEGTQELVELAPPELAEAAADLASLFVRMDELVAAQNYDPEFFSSDAIDALGQELIDDDLDDFFTSAEVGCGS